MWFVKSYESVFLLYVVYIIAKTGVYSSQKVQQVREAKSVKHAFFFFFTYTWTTIATDFVADHLWVSLTFSGCSSPSLANNPLTAGLSLELCRNCLPTYSSTVPSAVVKLATQNYTKTYLSLVGNLCKSGRVYTHRRTFFICSLYRLTHAQN